LETKYGVSATHSNEGFGTKTKNSNAKKSRKSKLLRGQGTLFGVAGQQKGLSSGELLGSGVDKARRENPNIGT